MQTVWTILQLFALALIFLLVYHVLNKYLLKKIKINRWIVLAFCGLSALAPSVYIAVTDATTIPAWSQIPLQGIMVILLLWFLELSGFMKKRQEQVAKKYEDKAKQRKYKRVEYKKDKNAIVPKSKANPRRAKK